MEKALQPKSSRFSLISKFGLPGFAALAVGLYLLHDYLQQQTEKLTQLHAIAAELAISEVPSGSQAGDPRLAGLESPLASFGQRLFFDERLSGHGTVACASCHRPEFAFTDNGEILAGNVPSRRQTMPLFNLSSQSWFFWDGRADSLISQAQGPLFHAAEHGLDRDRLQAVIAEYYRNDYEALFGPLPSANDALPEESPGEPIALPDALASYGLTSLGLGEWVAAGIRMTGEEKNSPWEALQRLPGFVAIKPSVPPAASNEMQAVDAVFVNSARALAAFQDTIVAGDAPFDRFVRGWTEAKRPEAAFGDGFGKEEFEGLTVFVGKAGCTNCHFGANFSDGQFHNIGLPAHQNRLDLGRAVGLQLSLHDRFRCDAMAGYGVPEPADSESCREKPYLRQDNPELLGAFKTPSLRQLGETAPYMHDGRFYELEEVINHYDRLEGTPTIGHREETLQPLNLDERERLALGAFLRSLNGKIWLRSVPAT